MYISNDGQESGLYTPVNSTVKSCGWVHCAACNKCFSAKTNKIGSCWKHTETYTHFQAVQKKRGGPTSNEAHELWLISAGLLKRSAVDKAARDNKKLKLNRVVGQSENATVTVGSTPTTARSTPTSAGSAPTATAGSTLAGASQNSSDVRPVNFAPLQRGVQLPHIWNTFNVSGISDVSQHRA